MKISNYRDAAAQLKSHWDGLILSPGSRRRVRLLRDDRVAELVRGRPKRQRPGDWDLAEQAATAARTEPSRRGGAGQRRGLWWLRSPRHRRTSRGRERRRPPTSTAVAGSQDLQRAEEALGRGNYDEALKGGERSAQYARRD